MMDNSEINKEDLDKAIKGLEKAATIISEAFKNFIEAVAKASKEFDKLEHELPKEDE